MAQRPLPGYSKRKRLVNAVSEMRGLDMYNKKQNFQIVLVLSSFFRVALLFFFREWICRLVLESRAISDRRVVASVGC